LVEDEKPRKSYSEELPEMQESLIERSRALGHAWAADEHAAPR
jgi:hypothetical protein